MRLDVEVREGDWATTSYSSLASNLGSRLLSQLRADSADPSAVWSSIETELLSQLVEVEVDPGSKVADLWGRQLTGQGHWRGRLGLGRRSQMRGPSEVTMTFVELPTYRSLAPTDTLKAAGLEDGDAVAILREHPAYAGYMLAPVPDPMEFIRALILPADDLPVASDYIWGVLLYTDEDVEVARYIRSHFADLNSLSGRVLRIGVVEKPDDWSAAKRYWKQHLDRREYRLYSNLRWLGFRPYDRSRMYEVAERLGVAPTELPCLVLFDSADRRDKLVFPISGATPSTFRRLFGAIRSAIKDTPQPLTGSRGRDADEDFDNWFDDDDEVRVPDEATPQPLGSSSQSPGYDDFDDWPHDDQLAEGASDDRTGPVGPKRGYDAIKSTYDELLAAIAESPSEPMAGVYNFYGHTLFINKPGGQVVVQDGQATGFGAEDGENVERKLQLPRTNNFHQ